MHKSIRNLKILRCLEALKLSIVVFFFLYFSRYHESALLLFKVLGALYRIPWGLRYLSSIRLYEIFLGLYLPLCHYCTSDVNHDELTRNLHCSRLS